MKHIISENSAVASSKKRPIDISKLKFVKESEDNYLEEFETNGYNVIKWLVGSTLTNTHSDCLKLMANQRLLF